MKRGPSPIKEKANIINDFAELVTQAIAQGLKETPTTAPTASLKREGKGLCITTNLNHRGIIDNSKIDKQLRAFIDIFPGLCEEHNISMLAGNTSVTTVRTPEAGITKYEFNISLDDMHKMMMKESEYYKGYRSGNSLLRLKNPNMELMKEDMICLFPALELEWGGAVMLRVAGCNVSEIISSQLAFYIKRYFPETSGKIYDHHFSPLTEQVLALDAADIFKAIASHFKLYNYRFILKNTKPPFFLGYTISFESKDNDLIYSSEVYDNNLGKYILLQGKIQAKDLPGFNPAEPLTLEKLYQHEEAIIKVISTNHKQIEIEYEQINHQTEDGFRVLKLTEKNRKALVRMDDKAFEIYNSLGSVVTQELENLKSIEIPVLEFLQELIYIQNMEIKKASVNQENNKLQKSKESVAKLEELSEKIRTQIFVSFISPSAANMPTSTNSASTLTSTSSNRMSISTGSTNEEELIVGQYRHSSNPINDTIIQNKMRAELYKKAYEIIPKIHENIKESEKYNHDGPIYVSLRQCGFNNFPSTAFINYQNNLTILESDIGKNAILKCIKEILLPSYSTMITEAKQALQEHWKGKDPNNHLIFYFETVVAEELAKVVILKLQHEQRAASKDMFGQLHDRLELVQAEINREREKSKKTTQTPKF